MIREILAVIAFVFLAYAIGTPVADDDAKNIAVFNPWEVPNDLCFDHDRILQDYWQYRHYGIRPQLRP
jgi:8-oxo-dGTP diphosphatase